MGDYTLSFITLFAGIFCLTGFAVLQSCLHRRRLGRKEWAELVGMLKPVPSAALKEIATDFLLPGGNQTRLQPMEIWDMIGKWEGLSAIYENTHVLCALTAQAERWNFDQAFVVTERVRRESWRVRVLVLQITLLYLSNSKRLWFKLPYLLEQAVATYYLLSTRVLSLYEVTHSARFAVIVDAL